MESPWYILNILRHLDRFGEPVPAFNIKGINQVKTAFGGIMTTMIMLFTLGYFNNKLNTALKKENPILNYIIN